MRISDWSSDVCSSDLGVSDAVFFVRSHLVGETVQVVVLAGRVIVRHAGEVVADHPVCDGRRQRVVDRAHLAGLVGTGPFRVTALPPTPPPACLGPPPVDEDVFGGGWSWKSEERRVGQEGRRTVESGGGP